MRQETKGHAISGLRYRRITERRITGGSEIRNGRETSGDRLIASVRDQRWLATSKRGEKREFQSALTFEYRR